MKRRKKPFSKALFIGSVCLLLFARPVFAREQGIAGRIVRVAYPIQEGLTDVDENGEYSGYTYEYLQEIAQYTGWQYEFVQVEGSEDEQLLTLMNMLEKGEVDLMGAMLYSEDLGRQYAFSSQSYGTVETVLQTTYAKAGSVNIDAHNDQTLHIAVLNTSSRTVRELEAYCKMNLITPSYILCDDSEEQKQAVEEGRADMLLNTSMNPLNDFCTVARFAPKPFYFMAPKDSHNTLLLEMDEAIQYLLQMNPHFPSTLFEKYFSGGEAALDITSEEQAYIQNAGTIRIGVLDHQPPFYDSAQEQKGGEGIAAGITKLLAQKTGLQLQLVSASDMNTLDEMAARDEIDLIAGIPYDYDNAAKRGLALSQPYLTLQYVLLMRQDVNENDLEGKTLSMTVSSPYHGYTVGTPVYYESRSDCVRAVLEKEADYTYVDACTAQYYGNLPAYWSLQQTPVSFKEMELSFGMVKPVDKALMSILNKTILTLSPKETQAVITASTIPERRLSFLAYMRQYPLQVLAVFLLITGVLVTLAFQRFRAGRRLVLEMKKREQVYELANDHFYEFNHKTQVLTIANPLVEGQNSGMSQFDYSGENADAEVGREFLKTLKEGREGEFEILDFCADGKKHWLHLVQKTVQGAPGKLSYTVGKVKIVDEEREEKQQLLTKAQRDGLTGAYNASTFRQLAKEVMEKPEENRCSAFLLMDIDHFKEINDVHGHMQGDRALVWLAGLLGEYFGQDSLIGRYGGDEFIVWQDHVRDISRLEQLCSGLCKAVRERSETAQGRMTISLGAVLVRRETVYERLFQAADEALYRVKDAGRDGVSVIEENL